MVPSGLIRGCFGVASGLLLSRFNSAGVLTTCERHQLTRARNASLVFCSPWLAAAFYLLVHGQVELADASRFFWLKRVHKGHEIIHGLRSGKFLLADCRSIDEIEQAAAQADGGIVRVAGACLEALDGVDSFSRTHDQPGKKTCWNMP